MINLFIFSWLSRRLSRGYLTERRPMNALVIILVFMALIGYFVTADQTMSAAKILGIILQAAVFFAILNSARTEQDILFLLRLMVVRTVILAFIGLVGMDWSQVRRSIIVHGCLVETLDPKASFHYFDDPCRYFADIWA